MNLTSDTIAAIVAAAKQDGYSVRDLRRIAGNYIRGGDPLMAGRYSDAADILEEQRKFEAKLKP